MRMIVTSLSMTILCLSVQCDASTRYPRASSRHRERRIDNRSDAQKAEQEIVRFIANEIVEKELRFFLCDNSEDPGHPALKRDLCAIAEKFGMRLRYGWFDHRWFALCGAKTEIMDIVEEIRDLNESMEEDMKIEKQKLFQLIKSKLNAHKPLRTDLVPSYFVIEMEREFQALEFKKKRIQQRYRD